MALGSGFGSSDNSLLAIMNLTLDYIEDWSSGVCVNAEHGPTDCYVDRHQLCAQHLLSAEQTWLYVHCNYQYQECLSYTTPPSGYPTCTLTGVLEGCANYTSTTYAKLHECATADESAKWAEASGDRSMAAPAGGHPLWVYIDGKAVTDTSGGVDAWATSVKEAICAAADVRGISTPTACQ